MRGGKGASFRCYIPNPLQSQAARQVSSALRLLKRGLRAEDIHCHWLQTSWGGGQGIQHSLLPRRPLEVFQQGQYLVAISEPLEP